MATKYYRRRNESDMDQLVKVHWYLYADTNQKQTRIYVTRLCRSLFQRCTRCFGFVFETLWARKLGCKPDQNLKRKFRMFSRYFQVWLRMVETLLKALKKKKIPEKNEMLSGIIVCLVALMWQKAQFRMWRDWCLIHTTWKEVKSITIYLLNVPEQLSIVIS